jgi:hypothetical protein
VVISQERVTRASAIAPHGTGLALGAGMAKKTPRKYGKTAAKKVARTMHERKHGTLRSGGSGKRVTSRKQAIAIGLSEARREGAKVPPPSKTKKRKRS